MVEDCYVIWDFGDGFFFWWSGDNVCYVSIFCGGRDCGGVIRFSFLCIVYCYDDYCGVVCGVSDGNWVYWVFFCVSDVVVVFSVGFIWCLCNLVCVLSIMCI